MTAAQVASAANNHVEQSMVLIQEAQTALRAAVASVNAAANSVGQASAAYSNAGSLITASTTTTGHALSAKCGALKNTLEQFRTALINASGACNTRLVEANGIKEDGEKYVRRLVSGG